MLRIATTLLHTVWTVASSVVTIAHIAHTSVTGARCGVFASHGTFSRTNAEQGAEVQRPSDYPTNKKAEPVIFN
tara:strand:- start:1401 stop:1622 length:222 start_codon:yes stop_codon:yes gene_type:complete